MFKVIFYQGLAIRGIFFGFVLDFNNPNTKKVVFSNYRQEEWGIDSVLYIDRNRVAEYK